MSLSPRLRIALAALLFSTGGAAIKMADFGAWQVASFRSGVAALALLILIPGAWRGIGWKPLLVGCAYAATLVAFVLANRLTTSANTIYLQSTAPLYLLLLGPFLLHERVRPRDLPVLAAVAAGLILVFLGNDAPSSTAPDPARGNLLAVVSGVSYALMLCGLRWLGRDGDAGGRGIAAVILGNAVACLATLPFALPLGHHPVQAWGVIFYLGVFQIGVAYTLVTTGIRSVPALEVSLLLLVETAFNPVWSWWLLGEVPSPFALAGGGLIIGATLLQSLRRSEKLPTLEPT
ncbi:MAG: DMT family transporter [Gemmatimonadota bacterium]